MVNTFKIGDEVRVISALSKMRDLEGKITAIRGENSYLPFIVDLKDFGEWSFKKDDLEFKDKSKNKLVKTGPNTFEVTIDKQMPFDVTVELADPKTLGTKRTYKKRDKTKPLKAKRKYTKRAK